MSLYPSMRLEEVVHMRVDLALELLTARNARMASARSGSSTPGVTRAANGVVRHHITSFDQLRSVMGGIR